MPAGERPLPLTPRPAAGSRYARMKSASRSPRSPGPAAPTPSARPSRGSSATPTRSASTRSGSWTTSSRSASVGPAEEPMLEGWTTLGFMAAHTKRARLGPDGRRHPLPPARAVGQGRDDARRPVRRPGLARASAPPGTRRSRAGLGFPFPPLGERFEMLEETLQIAHEMWQGERGTEAAFDGPPRPGDAAAELAPVAHPAPGPDHDRRRRRAEDAAPRGPVRRRHATSSATPEAIPTSTRSCASTARRSAATPTRSSARRSSRVRIALDGGRARRPQQIVDRFGELGDAGAQHVIFSVRRRLGPAGDRGASARDVIPGIHALP